jgi:hypothetical protein
LCSGHFLRQLWAESISYRPEWVEIMLHKSPGLLVSKENNIPFRRVQGQFCAIMLWLSSVKNYVPLAFGGKLWTELVPSYGMKQQFCFIKSPWWSLKCKNTHSTRLLKCENMHSTRVFDALNLNWKVVCKWCTLNLREREREIN